MPDEFRAAADTLFEFAPGQKHARTDPGRLQPSRVDAVVDFAERVAREYATLLSVGQSGGDALVDPGGWTPGPTLE